MESNFAYHNRVNWIDGMKINKNHFIETENALIQFSQWVASRNINSFNYGLLPYLGTEDAVDMKFSIDGQDTIRVALKTCKAVTASGNLIYITPQVSSLLEQKGSVIQTDYKFDNRTEEEFYIVLSVNPYVRIPVGEINPDEEPPRLPYALSEYKIRLVTMAETNEMGFGRNHITIGKVIFEEEIPRLLEEFIPPCVSIQSHQDLKYIYEEIHTFFGAIEKYSMNIIQKIYQKKQANDLARMVLTLSESLLKYMGEVLPAFRLLDREEPPVIMITKLMTLARVTKNNLDVYIGTGKEELLNYLSDWCDLNQGAFENVLIDMIELQYNHADINQSLSKVSDFTKLMLMLFKRLSELDYIGKKSDSYIFVKEKVVAKEDVKSRRSFLLD